MGRFLQVQQDPNHRLGLLLVRPSVSGYGFLDFQGRVFSQRYPLLGGCQKDDPPGMSQLEGAPGIHSMEDLFDRNNGG